MNDESGRKDNLYNKYNEIKTSPASKGGGFHFIFFSVQTSSH